MFVEWINEWVNNHFIILHRNQRKITTSACVKYIFLAKCKNILKYNTLRGIRLSWPEMNLLKWKIKIQTRFLPKFIINEFKVVHLVAFHLINESYDNKKSTDVQFQYDDKGENCLKSN